MSAPIRSLQIIASPRMGGAETSFLRLVPGLEAAGHPVICGVRDKAQILRHLDPRLPLETFPLRNYLDLGSIKLIRDAAQRHGVELIQTWASRATWLTRAPAGVVHIARLGGHYKPRYFRHAQGWIVNTRGMRQWMIARGFDAARVEWINNFVPALKPGEGPALSRASLGIPADALVVIALGRFFDKKGFQDLIPAFADLPARIAHRPLHLLLLGDGPRLAQLRASSAALGSRVHFTGWVDQAVAMLGLGDVFACPSRVEPMGNVILEAWSQGLPVVCTQTDGGMELIEDGVTGLLCPPQDVAALRACLHKLLHDPQRRQDLAQAGIAHYQQHYSEARTVDAVLDFYRRMLASGASNSR